MSGGTGGFELDDEAAAWHREVAIERFNRSWDLLDQPVRGPGEDAELLEAAFTSRYHWGVVGGASQRAVGDSQIARVAATVGLAELALFYAHRCLATVEAEGWTDFHLVSAHEVLARAHASAGDAVARQGALDRARVALEAIDDEEDRQLLADQIASSVARQGRARFTPAAHLEIGGGEIRPTHTDGGRGECK